MNNRDRSDAQTPEDVRDLRNRTEPHLFRGMAIAKVLQALTWQYEVQWNTSEKFTLWDLAPPDLRIVCEIMADELEQAHKVLSKLAPKLL